MIKNKTFENIVSLYVQQLFLYATPFLIQLLLIRRIGENLFGVYALGNVYLSYLVLIVDYGFNLSSTKYISRNKNNSTIFTKTIINRLYLFFFFSIIYALIVLNLEQFKPYNNYYLLNILIVFIHTFNTYFYFLGTQQLKPFVWGNVLQKIFFFLSIFLFVNSQGDLEKIQISLIVVNFIIGFWLFIKAYCMLTEISWNIKIDLRLLKDNFGLFLSRISSVGTTNLYTITLSLFLPLKFVTIFFVTEKIISTSSKLLIPVFEGIYPKMSQDFDSNLFDRLLKYCFIASCTISLILYLTSDIISLIYFEHHNIILVDNLKIMSMSIPFSILYMCFGANYLLANEQIWYFNFTSYMGFLLTVVSIIIIFINKDSLSSNHLFKLFSISYLIVKIFQFSMRASFFYLKRK